MKPIQGIAYADSRIFLTDVSQAAIAVYFCLVSHCTQSRPYCNPSVRRIAILCGVHRNTVTKTVAELKRAGLIRVVPRVQATSIFHINAALSLNNLSQIKAQLLAKSVPNKGTDDPQTVPNKGHEVKGTQHTDPDVSAYTATKHNWGKEYEADFWHWFCSLPIGGYANHTPDKLPRSVKKCRDAEWLLNRAWADHKWFKECQRLIEEWYSWPWGKPGDRRKLSVGALIRNWMEQVNTARLEIDTRNQSPDFRVL